jgi:histidinol dehydrogenase
MSVLDLSPAALAAVAPAVEALAAAEGFEAHARAVRYRVESAKKVEKKSRRASPLPRPLPRRGRGGKTRRANAKLRKVAP